MQEINRAYDEIPSSEECAGGGTAYGNTATYQLWSVPQVPFADIVA
jgi:hypothetical protein